jgi:hypothetical protein
MFRVVVPSFIVPRRIVDHTIIEIELTVSGLEEVYLMVAELAALYEISKHHSWA